MALSRSTEFVLEYRENILNRMREHVGMVFQSFNLFPHLTALENVTMGSGHRVQEVKALRHESGLWRCWAAWAWGIKHTAIRAPSPEGNSSESP